TRFSRDWSSDVCSSDLNEPLAHRLCPARRGAGGLQLRRGLTRDIEAPHGAIGAHRARGGAGDDDLVAGATEIADGDPGDHRGNHEGDAEDERGGNAGFGIHRILCPKAEATRPTASSAVWLNSSSTGFTSTRSIASTRP